MTVGALGAVRMPIHCGAVSSPLVSNECFSGRSQKTKKHRARQKNSGYVCRAYAAHRQPAHHLTHQRDLHSSWACRNICCSAAQGSARWWRGPKREGHETRKKEKKRLITAPHFPRCRLVRCFFQLTEEQTDGCRCICTFFVCRDHRHTARPTSGTPQRTKKHRGRSTEGSECSLAGACL